MGKWVIIFSISLGILIFLLGCLESKTNTTSYIKITEKGSTGKQHWTKVFDPNSSGHEEFKLVIDNENTWNLIEENQEYFATYEFISLDKGADMLSIAYPAKPK